MTTPAARSRALAISDRAYRILLAAYPPEFRQRYGPEMAQVFRASCRTSYGTSGAGGVVRLWLPTLWDWAWSTAGEWFSCLFRRFRVSSTYAWLAHSKLVTRFFFLVACLLALPFCCTGSGIFTATQLMSIETCGMKVNNQSGETIRVTPIDTSGSTLSAVHVYRASWPVLPAFRQRNISVNSGETSTIVVECNHPLSEIYVCDLDGECYVFSKSYFSYQQMQDSEYIDIHEDFTLKSLETPPRPDAALESAIQSIPEYDYSGVRNSLLCLISVIALLCGVYRVARARS